MKDGVVRSGVKLVARAVTMANVHATRALLRLRGEPEFELGGNCRLCAACCEAPSVRLSWLVWRLPTLRRVAIVWHGVVNGFELVETIPRQRVLVFRCTHFAPATRRCDCYATRPAMCRDYPRNLLHHARPDFLPGCGYSALHRRRDRVAEMLAAEDIPADKRAAIAREFYLGGAGPAPAAKPTAGRPDEPASATTVDSVND
jgi:Fe-S-cluster containining protein